MKYLIKSNPSNGHSFFMHFLLLVLGGKTYMGIKDFSQSLYKTSTVKGS